MAEEKEDIFALTKPSGLAAYPKWVHQPTGEKHKDGSDVVKSTLVQNPEEHKTLLAKNEPKETNIISTQNNNNGGWPNT